MTAPKFVFRNGKVVSRAKLAPKPEPVDNHLAAAIHHLNERLIRVEQALAALAAPAPRKRRGKPQSAGSSADHCQQSAGLPT